MKKYLIVFAALACVFAGCKKDENYTKIAFEEPDRVMVLGASEKFSLLWEPAGLAEPQCTWASSDEEVLEVDENGNVTAVGLGEANIVAKFNNELQAVCHVTVEMYEAMWGLSNDFYYFPDTKSKQPLNDSIYSFEYPSGIYECRLYSVEVLIPNSLEFDGGIGEGDCVYSEASMLFITKTPQGKEQFMGQPWELGLHIVSDSATYLTEPYSAFAGHIDVDITGAAWQSLMEQLDDEEAEDDPDFEKFIEDYSKGVSGAHMCSCELTATGARISSLYSGTINTGKIDAGWNDDDEYVVVYDFKAQWCYGYVPGVGYTGLQINPDATSYSEVLAQPFEANMSNLWHYQTGKMGIEIEENNAALRRAAKFNNLKARTTINRSNMVKVNLGEAKKIAAGR